MNEQRDPPRLMHDPSSGLGAALRAAQQQRPSAAQLRPVAEGLGSLLSSAVALSSTECPVSDLGQSVTSSPAHFAAAHEVVGAAGLKWSWAPLAWLGGGAILASSTLAVLPASENGRSGLPSVTAPTRAVPERLELRGGNAPLIRHDGVEAPRWGAEVRRIGEGPIDPREGREPAELGGSPLEAAGTLPLADETKRHSHSSALRGITSPAPQQYGDGVPRSSAPSGPPAEHSTSAALTEGEGATTSATRAQRAGQREVELLRRARVALESSPLTALLLTEEHRLAAAEQTLAEEREIIAIEALLRLQRTAEARARGGEFVRRYAHSAYLPRLQTLLSAVVPR